MNYNYNDNLWEGVISVPRYGVYNMKKLTAKKIVLILAALCIVIALITTNNVASVIVIYNARKGASTVQSTPVQNNTQSGVQSGVQTDPSSTNTGSNQQTPATPVENGSSTGTTEQETPATPTENGSSTPQETKPADNGNKNEDKPADKPADNGDKKDPGKTPSSKEEIVSFYVNAVNKAKSSASGVTLVKDGALNYQEIFEAGALSSFAGPLRSFFKLEDKNEPKDKNDIPPAGANCTVSAANVESATIKEANGAYTVEIIMKDVTNPKAGDGGVGSAVNIIQESQITGGVSSIPGISLSNIALQYSKVKMTATIDKATGNLTYLITDAPSILSLDAKIVFTEMKGARVGIEVVSEYKIAY